jgi:cell fate regulator YaaT (PSP1 superfamily)
MGCSSCSSNNGLPGGCKNNGACGTYGCNKLDVFDWLSGMEVPLGQKAFDIVEVRFKNSRKGFYRNSSALELYPGDIVAVEASPGHDIGVVSIVGELVRMQMKRKDVKDNYEVKKIFRKAKQEDIEKWQEARKLEQDTMMRARTIARALDLQMKISDVEYQGDKTKVTFFYTADDRVDFRELIKKYAEEFRVKIEMRQIGYRVEAGRLGGIGSCGRELCCSSWLTDFRAVSTSAARYQQLSLNPSKLAGQCGKLKCCLNYELDQYAEALKDLPSTSVRLKLPKGIASHFKTDIFKRTLYYVYEGQPGESPFPLSVEAVKEIIEMNKKGVAIEDVEDFMEEEVEVEETDFAQVVGQDSLTRFDQKRRKGPANRNKRGNQNRAQNKNENRNENRNKEPQRGAAGTREQGNKEQGTREPQRGAAGNKGAGNQNRNRAQGARGQGPKEPQRGATGTGEQGNKGTQGGAAGNKGTDNQNRNENENKNENREQGTREQGNQNRGPRRNNNNNRNRGPRRDKPNNPEGGEAK